MASNSKKNRGSNFNKEEALLLIEEIRIEQHIVECKTTNKVSVGEKERSWERITKNFNCKSFQNRSTEQLKSKFDNLKTKARKIAANERKYAKGTGGGPFLGGGLDPILEEVLKIINIKTVIGVNYNGDSDSFSAKYIPSNIIGTDIVGNEKTVVSSCTGDSIPVLVTIIEEKEDEETCVDIHSLDFYNEVMCVMLVKLRIYYLQGTSQTLHPPSVKHDHSYIELQDNETSNIKSTPKGHSLKRAADWSDYVPHKLKEPVSKRLRPTIENPLMPLKQEYHATKLVYLKQEIDWQKQRLDIAQRDEERRQEEHVMKMKILELEYKKLQKSWQEN